MLESDDKEFWNRQKSSLHRSDDEWFYRGKAEEHASAMSPQERSLEGIDLGCGAGELLFFFMDHANIKAGADYSQSMLDAAEERLKGKGISLLNVDIFDYLPTSNYPVWTTTGAINQYLDPARMNAFLDIFAKNETARSLFLFDCVDPVRYALMPFGISYRPPAVKGAKGLKDYLRPAYRRLRSLVLAARLASGLLEKNVRKLPGAGMGFGYLPRFWIGAAADRKLQIDIVSSRYYEYRYHISLRKISG